MFGFGERALPWEEPGIRKGKNTREYEGSFCSAYIGGCAAGNVLWADGRAVAPELRGGGGGGARQGERVAIHADAERDARLLEMNFGAWEGARLYEMDTPEVRWWFEDQLRRPALKGESIYQLRDRLRDFLKEKGSLGEDNLLIFAHGGIILSAELLLGKEVTGDPYDHLHPYGSVLSFEFGDL